MLSLFFMVFGSILAGLVLSLVWWGLWGRLGALPWSAASASAAVAGAAAVSFLVVERLVASGGFLGRVPLPSGLAGIWVDARFSAPLLIGIVGLVVLAVPVRRRRTGAADLSRRGPSSVVQRWWLAVPGVLLAVALGVTLLAGSASERDDEGHFTMYYRELVPGEVGSGVGIYGWYYSIPAMAAIAVLVTLVAVDLVLIVRPALDPSRPHDAAERRLRARSVISMATGALAVHLGVILSSLAGTVSSRGGAVIGDSWVTWGDPFGALEPALQWAGWSCAVIGVALWASIALAAIPARSSDRAPVSS